MKRTIRFGSISVSKDLLPEGHVDVRDLRILRVQDDALRDGLRPVHLVQQLGQRRGHDVDHVLPSAAVAPRFEAWRTAL